MIFIKMWNSKVTLNMLNLTRICLSSDASITAAIPSKVWIFGIVERSSVTVPGRSTRCRYTDTYNSETREAGESHIFRQLGCARWVNQLGYEHFSMSHKHPFQKEYQNLRMKEIAKVYTNTIEGAWKHAKDRKLNRTCLNNFEAYLAEVVWRNWHHGSLYTSFYELTKSYYMLDSPPHLEISNPPFQTWMGAVRTNSKKHFSGTTRLIRRGYTNSNPKSLLLPGMLLSLAENTTDDNPGASAGASPSKTPPPPRVHESSLHVGPLGIRSCRTFCSDLAW